MQPETKTPEVGVLVLNWNGRRLLETFLPSWIAHTPDWAELVIVDNGSDDDSLSYLSAHYPQVKVLPLGENLGFAAGYNRAIQELDYPMVVLLNSDVELTAGWLDEPRALLSDPTVVAVQPILRAERQRDHFEYAGAAGGFIDKWGYPLCRGRLLSTVEADHGQYADAAEILWASGACLIIRRDSYLEAGGLDPVFFAHQEEIDLCWRLRARGGRILCAPHSVVYHVGGASLGMDSPRKTFLNYRNNLLMLYKNLPERRLSQVLVVRLVLDLVSALIFLLQGKPRHMAAVLKGWRCFLIRRAQCEGARQENLRLTTTELMPQLIRPYSLVWQYYVRGRRTYSELPH